MLCFQTKFSCKPTSSLEDTTEIVIFWLYKPLLWPWHWTQWTIFCMTLWLMMLHSYTRFGNKIFCGSSDIIKTKRLLTFWTFAVTLTLNTVIPFFHRTLWLMILYDQTVFGCKRTSSFEDIEKTVKFRLYKPSLWPWHWRYLTNFSARHFTSW